MPETNWNPWKATAIAMAIVMVTAVVSGLVVANWTGNEERKAAAPAPAAPPAQTETARPTQARTARQAPAASGVVPSVPRPVASASAQPAAPAQPAVPTQAVVEACNQYAAQQTEPKNKTMEVVKDTAIGALVGAGVGAGGGAIADGGKGAGKGAAIGGLVGGGAGALYGVNENRKQDQRYRDAYAACMRSRGFAG